MDDNPACSADRIRQHFLQCIFCRHHLSGFRMLQHQMGGIKAAAGRTYAAANVVKAFYTCHTVPTLRTFNDRPESRRLGITSTGLMTKTT